MIFQKLPRDEKIYCKTFNERTCSLVNALRHVVNNLMGLSGNSLSANHTTNIAIKLNNNRTNGDP